jgi:uncharacterized membrane protein
MKLYIHLHFSRVKSIYKKRKSSIITKKNSQKKVRGVMEKRTFINVLFSKILLRNFGEICKKSVESIML